MDGQGNRVADAPTSVNHAVWWDADPLREIEDANWISKWDWNTSTLTRLLTADGAASNNGTKQNAALTGDLLGDWREEVMFRAADNLSLRIYSTTIPATNRLYTFMHDPQYRLAIAWQNVGYNQPPHPSFFVGDGMAAPPVPNITASRYRGAGIPQAVAEPPGVVAGQWAARAGDIHAKLVDLLDAAATARIVSVTSNGPRRMTTPNNPDFEIVGPLDVLLRAENNADGVRTYTIDVEGRDAAGNTVVVPVRSRCEIPRPE